MANEASKRVTCLPAEPLRRDQVGGRGVLYLCAVLHALARVEKPREPERLRHEPHKLVAQTLDGSQVLHERDLETWHVLLFRTLHIRSRQGSREAGDHHPITYISPNTFLLLYSKSQNTRTGRQTQGHNKDIGAHLRRTPQTQVLGLAGRPATIPILERRRKVELLALVRRAPGALDTETGVAEEVGRVGHPERVLALLWQHEEAGQVRDHLVEEGGGYRQMLEVEEADVDERVLQLLDECGAGVWRGEEVVVEGRDTREVSCGGHSQSQALVGCSEKGGGTNLA